MANIQLCMESWNYVTNVLVAVIGFGIVALLGVNIWHSFNINKTIKERVSEGLNSLRHENNELKNDLINHSTALLYLTTARQLGDSKIYDISFFYYLKGVESVTKIKKENWTTEMTDIYDQCLDDGLILLSGHNEVILESSTIKSMKKVIERILINVNDKRCCDIYSILYSLLNDD